MPPTFRKPRMIGRNWSSCLHESASLPAHEPPPPSTEFLAEKSRLLQALEEPLA